MNCPSCGYQNKPDVDTCNLCRVVLRKAPRKGNTVEIKPPAKRHTLEAVGSAPVELTPGVEHTIGRQATCSLAIPSTRVSRLHAVIRWEGEKPILTDKGSSNGTFVRGKRIKDHALQDGDEVEIGPYLCVYHFREPQTEAAAIEIGDRTQTLATGGDLFTGSIGSGGIAEVLQGIEFNGKSGTLDVFGKEGDGWISFEKGVPLAAVSNGGKVEEEAIFSLLGMKSGRFTFTPELEVKEKRVRTTITALLLEFGRRSDETTMRETSGD